MILLYSPGAIPPGIERELDKALEKDKARITYIGIDGADEHVILEAADFTHTKSVARKNGLSLLFQEEAS